MAVATDGICGKSHAYVRCNARECEMHDDARSRAPNDRDVVPDRPTRIYWYFSDK